MNAVVTNGVIVGTLSMRKVRGRKRQFLIGGGFDFDKIQTFANWQAIKEMNSVVEFHGEGLDGQPTCFSVVPLNS